MFPSSPEACWDDAIGIMVPDGSHLQESRPAALSRSFIRETWSVSGTGHGVIWWPDHSQESGRTKYLYD